jgi:hypothetical protein
VDCTRNNMLSPVSQGLVVLCPHHLPRANLLDLPATATLQPETLKHNAKNNVHQPSSPLELLYPLTPRRSLPRTSGSFRHRADDRRFFRSRHPPPCHAATPPRAENKRDSPRAVGGRIDGERTIVVVGFHMLSPASRMLSEA